MLEDATKRLDIDETDMLGTKKAKEMLEAANKTFDEININKNEEKVIHTQIAQKQKSNLTN